MAKARAHKALQAPDGEIHQHARTDLGVHRGGARAVRQRRAAQALAAGWIRCVQKTGSCALAGVRAPAPGCRPPSRAPCRGFFSPNCKQQRHHAHRLLGAFGVALLGVERIAVHNLLRQREHRLFDELDQPLKHLCLAGKAGGIAQLRSPSSWRARAAVVMRSAPGFSSMAARVCRICSRRSPGLGRLRVGLGGRDVGEKLRHR